MVTTEPGRGAGRPIDPMDLLWYSVLAFMAAAWLVSVARNRSTHSAGVMSAHPRALATRPGSRMLSDTFDPKANGLNLLRLVLATTVIVWHSFELTGRAVDHASVAQFLQDVPVDGFFAISGFLIAGSWVRRPHAAEFVRSRVMRIFPGFLVCLMITALVLAPIGILLSNATWPHDYWSDAAAYVAHNSSIRIVDYGIGDTPTDVPYHGVWNGSLWTLRWEFMCYAGILAIGLVGLLRRRAPSLVLFGGAFLLSVVTTYGSFDAYQAGTWARFATAFLAGTVVFMVRDRLPTSLPLTVGSGFVVLASMTLENYRIVGALFLAYFLVTASSYLRSPRLQFRNDVSYGMYIYAMPIQQILAGTSLVDAPVVIYMVGSVALTLPLAVASWFGIEKRASKIGRPSRQPLRLTS